MKNIVEKFLESIKGSELYPPLNNYSPFFQGSEWNTEKYFNTKYKTNLDDFSLFIISDKNESVAYISENVIKKESKEIFEKYLSDTKILKGILIEINNNIDLIDKAYSKITYDYISKTNTDSLLKEVDNVRNIIWESNALAGFSIYFQEDFCKEILNDNSINIDRFDEVWNTATAVPHLSFDKVQLLHVLDLLKQEKKLNDISEECQYIYTDYNNAKSLDIVKKRLQEDFGNYEGYNSKEIENAINSIISKNKDEINQLEKWKDDLNKTELNLAEYIATIIILRDKRKNMFNKGLTLMWRVAEKIFENSCVDKNLIKLYTWRELLLGKSYLDLNKDNLKKREDGFSWLVYHKKDPESELGDINNYKKLLEEYYLSKNLQKNNNIIKGQIGSKGFVKGRVKVITNINKSDHFEDGDILVTGMTRPEYVPLMKRSSAVITDEGGITCHAAIISRELGIPCVIATKIGTRVLKDGDMVEVDADNGVVRKIKK